MCPETINLAGTAEGILYRHQQQYRIVWAGTVGDYLVSPHVLPHRLTGNHYRDLLMLLEYVPLAVRARMQLIHDGAQARCSQ
jgi:hypothetical protein